MFSTLNPVIVKVKKKKKKSQALSEIQRKDSMQRYHKLEWPWS